MLVALSYVHESNKFRGQWCKILLQHKTPSCTIKIKYYTICARGGGGGGGAPMMSTTSRLFLTLSQTLSHAHTRARARTTPPISDVSVVISELCLYMRSWVIIERIPLCCVSRFFSPQCNRSIVSSTIDLHRRSDYFGCSTRRRVC